MKKIMLLIKPVCLLGVGFISFYLPLYATDDGMYVVDTIASTIYTENETALVLQSELSAPTITGNILTQEDHIFNTVVYAEAKKMTDTKHMKMVPDDAEMERGLTNIMQSNNTDKEGIEQTFASIGLTYKEGIDEIRKMQAINNVLEYQIHANVMITQQEVVDYCNQNPEYTEAEYCLRYAFVPFKNTLSRDAQKIAIAKSIEDDPWSLPFGKEFWVAAYKIDKQKEFIISMEPESYAGPFESSKGFEVYYLVQLKPRRLKTVQERFAEVANLLKRPRHIEKFNTYKQELLSQASVVHH